MVVVAVWPGLPQAFRVDVTLRSPLAERYRAASLRPGAVQAAAAKDKRDRYGDGVLCLPLGVFGRFGAAADYTLQVLAGAAAAARGDPGAAHRLSPRWRQALERAALWVEADVALLCFGRVAELARPRAGRRSLALAHGYSPAASSTTAPRSSNCRAIV